MDQIILYIQTNAYGIVGLTLLSATVSSIALAFAKKVVFYADYDDLAISAAMCALPAVLVVIAAMFVQHVAAFYLAGLVFVGLLIKVAHTTFRANSNSIWKTVLLLVGKLVMSFLYVAFLYKALAGEKRTDRGKGWFFLVILTPLLIALVHKRTGRFAIGRSGRLQVND